MQTLMQQLVRYEGDCCIYGYFMRRANSPIKEIAKHLGVTESTIRSWNKRIAEGSVQCGYGASGCGMCMFKRPQNTP